MREYLIKPEDTFFFRDSRPMESGAYGYGCGIPSPELIHSALRTALLRNSAQIVQEKKNSTHSSERKGRNKNLNSEGTTRKIGVDKYGSLRTTGPFPWHETHGALFPVPKDVLKIETKKLNLTKLTSCNIEVSVDDWNPKALPLSIVAATKDKPDGFWTLQQITAYLKDDKDDTYDFTPIEKNNIWREEWRVGVEIKPDSNSSKEGQLYSAGHMRMDDKAGFLVLADADEKDELNELKHVQAGGERRLASIVKPELAVLGNELAKPAHTDGDGQFILKWVLLTPAIFAKGAIPGWCWDSTKTGNLNPPGVVCLKDLEGKAELVACTVGDPVAVSGWDKLDNQAKPTLYAVQSGAVYYFHCENAETANKLAEKIHWRPRSDMLGEKGYGYGVCSIQKTDLIFDK